MAAQMAAPDTKLYSPVYSPPEVSLYEKYMSNLKLLFVDCIPCQIVLTVLVISILFELKKYICGEKKSSCLKIFKKMISAIIGTFITISIFQFNGTVAWAWTSLVILFVVFSNLNTVCECIKGMLT